MSAQNQSVYKKFAGQTFIYGASTILAKLLNFILIPYYSRIFNRAVLGVYTTLYANASIIGALLAFGMETSFFRYVNKHEDRKEEVYNNTFWYIFFISTLFLITGLSFNHFLVGQIFGDFTQYESRKLYVNLILYITFVDAISVIPFAKLRSEGKSMRYGIIKLTDIITFISFNLFFLWFLPLAIRHHWIFTNGVPTWYHQGWLGYVLIGNLIASSVTFLMLFPQVKSLTLKIDVVIFKNMLKYSWPVLIANLSFIINENIDKIMLTRLLPHGISEAQVGVYGACAKIAVFLNIFIQGYRLGAEPFFFSHAKNANAKNNYAQLMNYFVMAVSIIFLGIIANIQWLKYFIGENYWEGLQVVPFLLMGYVCLGIYMNLSIWYRLTDQTKYGVYISAIGAVITVMLNWIFIPRYSYMASAMVTFLAYFVMMVVSFLWGQKHYHIPYQLKKCVSILLAAFVLSVASFWIFDKNLIIGNLFLLIFVGIIFYFEKNNLMKLLKK